MRQAAPSIFAEGKHASRSERYTYIPTIEVLRGLRKEGFEPFMVAQSKSRIEGKTEFTKHLIRMRHAGQVATRPEANEIILINSHDGASCYQLLAGAFRLWPAGHRAESLLPGGRGAMARAGETVLPRVRWAKDPVGLNRRHDGGVLWVLNRWRLSKAVGRNQAMPALQRLQDGSQAPKLWPH